MRSFPARWALLALVVLSLAALVSLAGCSTMGDFAGIPRAEADAMFAKLGNLQEMFASIVAWPLNKIGS
jgi:hypothetical protein